MASSSIEIPRIEDWPGAFGSYKTVKDFIKTNVWHFVSIIGIWIIATWVVSFIFRAIFKNTYTYDLVDNLFSILLGAFTQAAFIVMYFYSLRGKAFELREIIDYGLKNMLKMCGLLIIMDIIFVVSLVLLIVPFLFVLPRLYLAPYFMVVDNISIGEAIGFSWNLTKGHSAEVYGVIGIDILIVLLFLTIIGIPFAIYFWIINNGSLAYLTLYLSQTESKPKSKKLTKAQAA